MKVKICGITNLEDAQFAIKNGADALGFLVDVPEAREIKRITKNAAKNIISRVPKNIWTFALTISKNYLDIINLCKELNCTHVQIIEDISLKDLINIKNSIPNLKIVKAICVTDKSAISDAVKYSKVSDFILLDSRIKGQRGGTGKTHNWNISKEIVKVVNKPVFLAGGLSPDNVESAISKVKPFGVDVDTKLEKEPGKKDYDKVKEFIKIAKNNIK